MNKKVSEIQINHIVESVDNARQVYDEKEMAELMVSMRQTGLLQPVTVKELRPGHYKLIFGFRRLHAAQKLGWKQIDAFVISTKDNVEDVILNSIENIQRVNPSFPQQGRQFASLMKKGLTGAQIAARVGCTSDFVRDVLRAYYSIPKVIQKKITASNLGGRKIVPGGISPSAAFTVARIAKDQKLTEHQATMLYEYCTKPNVGKGQMYVVGNLLGQGYSPREAVAHAQKTRVVTVQFAIDMQQCLALERKYKLKIHDIAYSWLEQNKEMEIYPMREKHKNKTVIVTRKGAK